MDTTGEFLLILLEKYLLFYRFVVDICMDGVCDQEKAEKEGRHTITSCSG